MAILHVRNVPDDLYTQLRERAEAERRSLSAEVVVLLQQAMAQRVATDLQAQAALYERIRQQREELARTVGTFPSSVELIREDRDR